MVRNPVPLTVVLILDHASVTGGQARVAFDSAIGLKRAGHEPIVFAATGPVAPELAAAGVRTVCLGQADLIGNRSIVAAAAQGLWNGAAADALRGLLASVPRGRSVVHVHGWAKALSPRHRGADRGIRPAGRLHAPRIFAPLPQRRLLQLPNGATLRAQAPVGSLLGDELRFARLQPQAVAGHAPRRDGAGGEAAGRFPGYRDDLALPGRGRRPARCRRRAPSPRVEPDRRRPDGAEARRRAGAAHLRGPDLAREGPIPLRGKPRGGPARKPCRRRRPVARRAEAALSGDPHRGLAGARSGAPLPAGGRRAGVSLDLVRGPAPHRARSQGFGHAR